MIKEKIGEYDIPFKDIPAIKAGADWAKPNGALISNEELTLPPARSRSFAFCSDTAYSESIIPIIEGVDLLYHEATFLHEDLDKAISTNHTTALQAATIAKKANVEKLVLGHYSARYDEIDAHLTEAKSVFTATALGVDGGVFEV